MTDPSATARLGFSPAQKLRAAADFQRTRKAGRRIGDALFGIHYLANERGHARLGMAVSAKAVGGAVRRNRVRRLVRESFRLHQQDLPAVDIFVTARAAARGAPNAAVVASLERLWRQIRTS